MEQKPYKAPQLPSLLGVSHSTVTAWLRSGKLKGSRVGSRWRIAPADLDAFLREGGHQ